MKLNVNKRNMFTFFLVKVDLYVHGIKKCEKIKDK